MSIWFLGWPGRWTSLSLYTAEVSMPPPKIHRTAAKANGLSVFEFQIQVDCFLDTSTQVIDKIKIYLVITLRVRWECIILWLLYIQPAYVSDAFLNRWTLKICHLFFFMSEPKNACVIFGEAMWARSVETGWWLAVCLFKPIHWLGRPENELFVLPKILFLGYKYPKSISFDFENNNTDRHGPKRYCYQ